MRPKRRASLKAIVARRVSSGNISQLSDALLRISTALIYRTSLEEVGSENSEIGNLRFTR